MLFRPSKSKETKRPCEIEEKMDDDMFKEDQKDHSMSEHIAMMCTTPHSLHNGNHIKREVESSFQEHPFPCLPSDVMAPAPSFFNPMMDPFHLAATSAYLHRPDLKDFNLMPSYLEAFHYPFFPSLVSPDTATDLLKEIHLSHMRKLHNLNKSQQNQPPPAHGSQLRLPLLVNIVRKLVYERFMEIKRHHRKRRIERDDDKEEIPIDASKRRHTTPNDHLMPSYRQTSLFDLSNKKEDLSARQSPQHLYHHQQQHEHDGVETPLKQFGKVNERSWIGDTLKDIIGKTISEKMKQWDNKSSDEETFPKNSTEYTRQSLHIEKKKQANLYKEEADSTTNPEKSPSYPPLKQSKKDVLKNRSVQSKSPTSENMTSSKKTRPKRGQYRKYNSQLLMDAVRAVQRGEMSVHRAGSFFGVPHSTLEYKVKERHLLRQRKGRDSSSVSSASPPKIEVRETPLVTRINLSPALSETSITSKKCTKSRNSTSPMSSPIPSTLNVNNFESKNLPSTKTPRIPSKSAEAKLDQKERRGGGGMLSISLSPPTFASTTASPPTTPSRLSAQSQQDLSWLQPYLSSAASSSSSSVPGHSTSLSLAEGFPATTSLALNTSASELLRKLQHKVASKEDILSCHPLPPIQVSLSGVQMPTFELEASSKENSNELAETLAVFQ